MASAPQQPTLPLFYNDLMPLNSRDHGKFRTKQIDDAKFMKSQHAIPLTVDEFVQAQRAYPIVFSSGDQPLPLALMGLNEGVNTYVDEQGKVNEPVYIPAYIRRYPFMLARLSPEAEELSLCFDPTQDGVIGDFEEGERLFDDEGKVTESTKQILEFCEQFEAAGQRTRAFMDELKKADLLMDGEMSISRQEAPDTPYIYRGFQMINQDKLREIDGETAKAWSDNGLLMLVHAHIFSLDMFRTIFSRQVQQGTAPEAFTGEPVLN